mgnify:CR=1 FL=1|tara:strand:+ start:652 stop:963 length:312 start_codon:yes stop_codon:yes gene_type:complete
MKNSAVKHIYQFVKRAPGYPPIPYHLQYETRDFNVKQAQSPQYKHIRVHNVEDFMDNIFKIHRVPIHLTLKLDELILQKHKDTHKLITTDRHPQDNISNKTDE